MNAQSYIHAEPNDLIYTVKTHYAGLLLDRLREIDDLRANPSTKHNPKRVHITEIFNDGSEDNTHPTYKLTYHAKQATHVFEIIIAESSSASSNRIVKTMTLNDDETRYTYTFLVHVLRGFDGNPIILPAGDESVTDKNAESKIAELDQEVLATFSLCVN